MKFPLRERPFDLLRLSAERAAQLQTLADEIVDANLNEFYNFVHTHNRSLPKHKYKPVKTHGQVTIYKEKTARGERVFGPHGQPQRRGAPLLPKLVATGRLRGTMEDMLLGTAVRDAMSVMVKTSYVDDEIVDCAVHEIEGASEDDPFRYVSLKWIVKAHPTGLNAIVAPRDLVLLQSSGLIANEGIGYHLVHSADELVPQVLSYEDKYGILRARTSTMFMFRQFAPDVIECYTVNYVEPNGRAPETVAIMSTAASMGGIWKSLECAYNMKLSWILKNKEAYMGPHDAAVPISYDDKCDLCHKKATLTGSMGDCSLCDKHVCSRCRITRKLSKANHRLELKVEKFEFCKTCFYRVVKEDAVRIALEMYLGDRITSWRVADERESQSSRGSFASFYSASYRSTVHEHPERIVPHEFPHEHHGEIPQEHDEKQNGSRSSATEDDVEAQSLQEPDSELESEKHVESSQHDRDKKTAEHQRPVSVSKLWIPEGGASETRPRRRSV